MSKSTVDTLKEETKTENKVKTVKIIIPKITPNQENQYVSVNGEAYWLTPGEEYEVPDYIYEVIKHSQEQKMRNIEDIERRSKKDR